MIFKFLFSNKINQNKYSTRQNFDNHKTIYTNEDELKAMKDRRALSFRQKSDLIENNESQPKGDAGNRTTLDNYYLEKSGSFPSFSEGSWLATNYRQE